MRGPLVYDVHEEPDVPDLVAAGRRAADATRAVVDALVGTTADAATMADLVTTLERIADVVVAHESTTRFDAATIYEAHPIVGPSNPLAPPVWMEREGDRAVSTVTFGHVYEGPRGHVHGGWLAAVFDLAMITAAALSRSQGMTGTLTVRYRKPVPLDVPVVFESWLVDVDGRKVRVAGHARVDETVMAEAEAVLFRAT